MHKFIQRLKKERHELDKNYTKLGSYLSTGQQSNLSKNQANLLHLQHNTMGTYINILDMRLDDLGEQNDGE